MDVALIKYRVAAVHTPNSAQLWNKPGTEICHTEALEMTQSLKFLSRT